jgi:hypothetical protein
MTCITIGFAASSCSYISYLYITNYEVLGLDNENTILLVEYRSTSPLESLGAISDNIFMKDGEKCIRVKFPNTAIPRIIQFYAEDKVVERIVCRDFDGTYLYYALNDMLIAVDKRKLIMHLPHNYTRTPVSVNTYNFNDHHSIMSDKIGTATTPTGGQDP